MSQTRGTPLACSECGRTGTYADDSSEYNFARCCFCGNVVHPGDFQLDEGETLVFENNVLCVVPAPDVQHSPSCFCEDCV